jgi:hypothetical protein
MNIPRNVRAVGMGDISLGEAAEDFKYLAWGVAALFGVLIVLKMRGK